MKPMFLALLAVAAGTASAFSTHFTLNSTDVCYDGVFNHTLLETNTSGWAYNATGCSVAANSFVNISGAALPVLYVGVKPVPVGMVFNGGTVGSGSALVIHGPLSNKARATVPWLVDIIGNTFERDAQLRVLGSIPINSTITISSNSFDVYDSNPFLTDTLDRVLAISVGGQLTGAFEPMSIYLNSALNITSNEIKVNAVTAEKTGAGIAVLSDIYFTNDTDLRINDNVVEAVCGQQWMCSGFDFASDTFLDMVVDYYNAHAHLDRNKFTVKNGRGFVVPSVWSPNSTFYLSASHNILSLDTDSAAAFYVLEHAISIFQMAAGRQTTVDVLFNTVTSIGNRMIFFGGAVDFAEDSLLNCSWNDIFTTAGDPGVYVLDQLSIVDRARVAIDSNRFQRQDTTVVSRPYLTLTFDFSVLGYAELSFRENECYPSNTQSGPYLVSFTSGKVANVGPTAYFAVCGNIYNGNPADLLTATILTSNIRSIVNCNARPTTATDPTEEPSTEPTNTTTATDGPTGPSDNSASRSTALVAVAALVAAVAASML
eukprot:GILI01000565.1.p1 GENE.GILI01000565.1~~GILI01000565.1.p1  ORF type:complete len:543 (+),score=185.07 GILI01000565.1:44-1672(+)